MIFFCFLKEGHELLMTSFYSSLFSFRIYLAASLHRNRRYFWSELKANRVNWSVLIVKRDLKKDQLDDVLNRRRRDAWQWRFVGRQGANYLRNFIAAMYSAHVIAKYSACRSRAITLSTPTRHVFAGRSRAWSPRWPRGYLWESTVDHP